MHHSLFPYEPRKNQLEILNLIKDTVDTRSHLVLESKTGSGKTICALSPTLEYAIEHDKKVLREKIRFILPKSIGDVFITDEVSPSLIRQALAGNIGNK